MAYEKFIKAVQSEKLLKEIERHLVFVKNCNRDFEGEVKQLGDQIRVDGLGDVTVYQLKKDGTYTASQIGTNSIAGTGKEIIHKGIPNAEEPVGYSATFTVNQLALWNEMIGDIDAELVKDAQGKVAKYRKKIAAKVANLQDQYVAKTITGFNDAEFVDTGHTKGQAYTITTADNPTGKTNILEFIDAMVQVFHERDFPQGVTLSFECGPAFIRRLKKAARELLTNNVDEYTKREVTVYNGINFYMTNNAVVGGVEYVIARTEEAVSFFDAMAENEAYRIERGFGDGWKGFVLYDCGITNPKAMLWAKVTY